METLVYKISRTKLWKIIVWLFLIVSWLLIAQPIYAQVFITEILPAPNSEQTEAVEIYNSSAEDLDLTAWTLWDVESTSSLLEEFSEVLLANSTLVILTNNKLNNSGDGLILKNGQQEIIDQVDFESAQSGFSWALINGGWQWSSPDLNHFDAANLEKTSPPPSAVTYPSPSVFPSTSPLASVSPSPSPSPPLLDESSYLNWQLEISSFQACPESGDQEWLELTNLDHENHLFTDWIIGDEANNERKFSLELVAQSSVQISWTGSMLNNSGDTIYLKTPQGTTVKQVEYVDCDQVLGTTIEETTHQDDSGNDPHNSASSADLNQGSNSTDESTSHQSATNKNNHNLTQLFYKNYQPDLNSNFSDELAVNESNSTQPDGNTEQSNHIFFSFLAKLDFFKLGVISVILGGLLLLSSGILFFYESFETDSSEKNPHPALSETSWAFGLG